jgi:hypothetical protein
VTEENSSKRDTGGGHVNVMAEGKSARKEEQNCRQHGEFQGICFPAEKVTNSSIVLKN